MPKCKDCALFEDCMADENDVPENFDCEDFTPKEEAPTEEVIEEAEEVWGEEAEMTNEFEGFDEEETKEAEPEPEPEPESKPKPKPKKPKAKPGPKPKAKPKKETKTKEAPKEALQKEKVSDSLEDKIRKAIKDREDIMVIKVKFLIELAETNPKLKKEMEMDTLLDKLADLVTTTEATKIVASLL